MANQIDLVELTKRRLTRLNGVQKMENNALGTIIRSINPYAALIPSNHLATYLPFEMCDKIIQHLFVEMKENPEINKIEYLFKIPFLLNASTKFLDLDALLPQRKAIFTDDIKAIENEELHVVKWVIDKVKNQAPNIEHIVLNSRDIDFRNEEHFKLLDYLTKLKHLKILEMKYLYLGTVQLTKLCRMMPKLQILDIYGFEKFGGFEVTEEEIRHSLGNLRLLVGYSNVVETRAIQQQFPYLNITSSCESEVQTTFRHYKFEDFLVSENEKGTPGKRKCFSCDEDWFKSPDMEIHLKHPDVTHLEILCQYLGNFSTALQMPKFSKIRSLIAWSAKNEKAVADILRLYGRGLRMLCLEDSDQRNFDGKILELCPKLESIQLFKVGFDGTSLQMEKIPNLKELFINDIAGSNRGNFLPKVLSSPHLTTVEIFDVLCKEDFVELNKMVSKNQILQKLQTLKIYSNGVYSDPVAFKELVDFLENISAFLPKLKDIHFVYNNGQEYVDLANRLKNDHECSRNEIRNIVVNNATLVPILELFSNHRP